MDEQLRGLVLRQSVSDALCCPGERSVQGLRDLRTCSAFVSGSGIFPILDAPWTPIFIVLIFLLHPTLGWLSIAGMLLLVLLGITSEISTRRLFDEWKTKSVKMLSDAESAVRNADAVEAMGMMPNILRRWNRANAAAMELRGGQTIALAGLEHLRTHAGCFCRSACWGLAPGWSWGTSSPLAA